MTSRFAASAAALLAFAAAAQSCGDDGTGTRLPAEATVVGGASQTGRVGELLPEPVVVRVTDFLGQAVAGVPVAWIVRAPGGLRPELLETATNATNSDGEARATLRLSERPGQHSVEAAIEGLLGRPVAVAFAEPGFVASTDPTHMDLAARVRERIISFDGFGNVIREDRLLYAPLDPAVVTVSVNGFASGQAEGETVIRVSNGGPSVDVSARVWGPATFADIAVGADRACGLNSVGSAYCWGSRTEPSALGTGAAPEACSREPETGPFFPCNPVPVPVGGGVEFRTLAVGGTHACGLTVPGAVYCWGRGNGAGAGIGEEVPGPVLVSQGPFASIAAGGDHTCALDGSGAAFCWGGNLAGQLGDGTFVSRPDPQPVAAAVTFSDLGLGGGATCGVATDGVLHCWGSRITVGRDVGGGFEDFPLPEPVQSTERFRQVRVGSGHACALTLNGRAFCWGRGRQGQLGRSAFISADLVPKAVAGGPSFAELAVGASQSCALDFDGGAWCWGDNDDGQLGLETSSDRANPSPVVGGLRWVEMSTGGHSMTCGLTVDSFTYCWGANGLGQAGVGTNGLPAALLAPAGVVTPDFPRP